MFDDSQERPKQASLASNSEGATLTIASEGKESPSGQQRPVASGQQEPKKIQQRYPASMATVASGSNLPVALERGDPGETFRALADQFHLNEETMAHIKENKIETLNDLRFMFASEDEVATFLSKVKELPQKELMTSRLRQAWHAIRTQATVREADRSKVETADLDDMLDDSQLNDVKQAFWRRYKVRYPPEVMPADALVSRCSREMSKRMLMVFNVNGVKNLMHQVTTSKKRKKLGTDLYTEQEETFIDSVDATQYLDRLYTYLLALALAGATPLPTQDGLTETNAGAKTTQFVHVPLDIVMEYFWRAKRACHAQAPSNKLRWIEKQDVSERAQWVTAFRDSEDTLGTVISNTMNLRDAHWTVNEAVESHQRESATAMDSPVKTPRKQPGGKGKGGKEQKGSVQSPPKDKIICGYRCSLALKSGEKLCEAFQLGHCKANGSCPRGRHQCAVLVNDSGRVCGMTSHGAADHY